MKTNKEHNTGLVHTIDTSNKSLDEINGSIPVPKNAGFWKTLLAYTGPGILIAVGYMDPGNWVTSIAGGAQFKYRLLAVILISSLIAMMLQAMSAKLGIVTGKDLAQITGEKTNKPLRMGLWVVAELAIMATDVAEIIGSGIALQLLFKIPLVMGIMITALDVLLLLLLMKMGFRKIEAIVATLVAVIVLVFAYEVILSQPSMGGILKGYVPSSSIVTNHSMLYLSLGIVGATVMPHDLYLGSSISQTREIDRSDKRNVAKAIKFTTLDSSIQLTVAFVVNSLLLILGASLFYGTDSSLGRFADLFNALSSSQIVGAIASPMLSMLFAVALLASGQSSTITGTLSGQIVMEGFIRLKVPLWVQRLITRLISVTPVLAFAIYYHGNEGKIEKLLTFSQVFLSIALPFAIIPLVLFTSSKKIMGEFANGKLLKWVAWFATVVLIGLNIYLLLQTVGVIQ